MLDPQLYLPRSERRNLQTHPYFPSDLDTADLTSDSWWAARAASLAGYAKQLGVDAVASPVILPNVWNDDYFARCADTSSKLFGELNESKIRTLTTVMLNFNQMGEKDAALRIASIVSESESSGYYLVIVSETEPRRELTGEKELLGLMILIRELESTGRPVLVSHCSSDMLLFKAAGASYCATGKFFNLRRFTKSRYEEPSSGGGQIAYWFEHSLIAFLRQADILRLLDKGFRRLVGTHASNNCWGDEILEQFLSAPQSAWVAKGWRQYLCWFGKTEATISADNDPKALVREWLRTAEGNWLEVEDKNILFDEPRNNGSWIRPWRQALSDFSG